MASTSARKQHVKLFRHKGGQAVPIPHELELDGSEATVRREGNRLVIEPTEPRADEPQSLLEYLRTLEPLEKGLDPIPDLPAEPVEL